MDDTLTLADIRKLRYQKSRVSLKTLESPASPHHSKPSSYKRCHVSTSDPVPARGFDPVELLGFLRDIAVALPPVAKKADADRVLRLSAQAYSYWHSVSLCRSSEVGEDFLPERFLGFVHGLAVSVDGGDGDFGRELAQVDAYRKFVSVRPQWTWSYLEDMESDGEECDGSDEEIPNSLSTSEESCGEISDFEDDISLEIKKELFHHKDDISTKTQEEEFQDKMQDARYICEINLHDFSVLEEEYDSVLGKFEAGDYCVGKKIEMTNSSTNCSSEEDAYVEDNRNCSHVSQAVQESANTTEISEYEIYMGLLPSFIANDLDQTIADPNGHKLIVQSELNGDVDRISATTTLNSRQEQEDTVECLSQSIPVPEGDSLVLSTLCLEEDLPKNLTGNCWGPSYGDDMLKIDAKFEPCANTCTAKSDDSSTSETMNVISSAISPVHGHVGNIMLGPSIGSPVKNENSSVVIPSASRRPYCSDDMLKLDLKSEPCVNTGTAKGADSSTSGAKNVISNAISPEKVSQGQVEEIVLGQSISTAVKNENSSVAIPSTNTCSPSSPSRGVQVLFDPANDPEANSGNTMLTFDHNFTQCVDGNICFSNNDSNQDATSYNGSFSNPPFESSYGVPLEQSSEQYASSDSSNCWSPLSNTNCTNLIMKNLRSSHGDTRTNNEDIEASTIDDQATPSSYTYHGGDSIHRQQTSTLVEREPKTSSNDKKRSISSLELEKQASESTPHKKERINCYTPDYSELRRLYASPLTRNESYSPTVSHRCNEDIEARTVGDQATTFSYACHGGDIIHKQQKSTLVEQASKQSSNDKKRSSSSLESAKQASESNSHKKKRTSCYTADILELRRLYASPLTRNESEFPTVSYRCNEVNTATNEDASLTLPVHASKSTSDRNRSNLSSSKHADPIVSRDKGTSRHISDDNSSEHRVYASTSATVRSKAPTESQMPDRDSNIPKALHMKFPRNFTAPSKQELIKKFAGFGQLDHLTTKVSTITGAAQVVFLDQSDADSAYAYVVRKNVFGGANVRFWFDKLADPKKVIRSTSTFKTPSVNLKSCLKRPERDTCEKRKVRFSV